MKGLITNDNDVQSLPRDWTEGKIKSRGADWLEADLLAAVIHQHDNKSNLYGLISRLQSHATETDKLLMNWVY